MMIIMMMKPSWHLEDLREDTPIWQEVIQQKSSSQKIKKGFKLVMI